MDKDCVLTHLKIKIKWGVGENYLVFVNRKKQFDSCNCCSCHEAQFKLAHLVLKTEFCLCQISAD